MARWNALDPQGSQSASSEKYFAMRRCFPSFRYGVPVDQCIGALKLGDLTIELFEPIEIDAANAGNPVGLSFQSFDEHHRIAFWRLDVPQDLIDQFFGRLKVEVERLQTRLILAPGLGQVRYATTRNRRC